MSTFPPAFKVPTVLSGSDPGIGPVSNYGMHFVFGLLMSEPSKQLGLLVLRIIRIILYLKAYQARQLFICFTFTPPLTGDSY